MDGQAKEVKVKRPRLTPEEKIKKLTGEIAEYDKKIKELRAKIKDLADKKRKLEQQVTKLQVGIMNQIMSKADVNIGDIGVSIESDALEKMIKFNAMDKNKPETNTGSNTGGTNTGYKHNRNNKEKN